MKPRETAPTKQSPVTVSYNNEGYTERVIVSALATYGLRICSGEYVESWDIRVVSWSSLVPTTRSGYTRCKLRTCNMPHCTQQHIPSLPHRRQIAFTLIYESQCLVPPIMYWFDGMHFHDIEFFFNQKRETSARRPTRWREGGHSSRSLRIHWSFLWWREGEMTYGGMSRWSPCILVPKNGPGVSRS